MRAGFVRSTSGKLEIQLALIIKFSVLTLESDGISPPYLSPNQTVHAQSLDSVSRTLVQTGPLEPSKLPGRPFPLYDASILRFRKRKSRTSYGPTVGFHGIAISSEFQNLTVKVSPLQCGPLYQFSFPIKAPLFAKAGALSG